MAKGTDIGTSDAADAEDIRIVREIGGGDVNAYRLLVEKYQGYVGKIVSKHVPRRMVEEVSHEVFVSAYASLSSYSQERPFRHWLAALAVRRSYDYWRKAYRSKEIPASQLSKENEDWLHRTAAGCAVQAAVDEQRARDGRAVLAAALSRLPAEDRMLVALIHFDGYSLAEAARLLGWTLVSVKVRMFRLRGKLRKIIIEMLQAEEKAL